MKSLTLFRHAKTERDSESGSDFDRRLAERGQHDSRRMGEEIERLGLDFDLVLSSPAARAAETAELAGPYADRMTELFTLLDEHHPHEPHEYLFFIGVRPGAQGRGIGGALLAPVLARADAAGHPCYLEASSLRSRELYERHGFRATAEIAPAGGAPLWPMVRDPQ